MEAVLSSKDRYHLVLFSRMKYYFIDRASVSAGTSTPHFNGITRSLMASLAWLQCEERHHSKATLRTDLIKSEKNVNAHRCKAGAFKKNQSTGERSRGT